MQVNETQLHEQVAQLSAFSDRIAAFTNDDEAMRVQQTLEIERADRLQQEVTRLLEERSQKEHELDVAQEELEHRKR